MMMRVSFKMSGGICLWLALVGCCFFNTTVMAETQEPKSTDKSIQTSNANASSEESLAEKKKREFRELCERADAGNPDALVELGRYYEEICQMRKAFDCFRKAADKGSAKGYYQLSLAYQDGSGVKRDKKLAVEMTMKAAECGHSPAQRRLGNFYSKGEGVAKDTVLADAWYKKAFDTATKDADKGSTDSMKLLASMYANGTGVEKDVGKAVEWYERAAEAGSAYDKQRLAYQFETGVTLPRNLEKAEEWRRKAAAEFRQLADKGDPEAQRELGSIYDLGLGVPEDNKKAMEWYRKAAEQGDAEAQYEIGDFYLGSQNQLEQVMKWYMKAAENGHAGAAYDLGMLCEMGGEIDKAILWYKKVVELEMTDCAVSKGFIDYFVQSSQCSLGEIYEKGEGVAKDYMQSAMWYRKAAVQGDSTAQYALARFYSQGLGVKKEITTAYMWAILATSESPVSLGDESFTGRHIKEKRANFVKMRDSMESEMTPEQIAEGQRRAAQFEKLSTYEASILEDEVAPSTTSPSDTSKSEEMVGSGSGFFITADGWLATNAHVVQAGTRIKVKIGDNLLAAQPGPVDAGNDLALLKISGEGKPIPIQSSRGVKLGDTIITVGFPNPGLQGVAPKMAKGEISSLTGITDDPRCFQISAPIQPGNSGGALVDVMGNVVGVVCARMDDLTAIKTSGAFPQNINYAVKSSYLLALAESLPEVSKGLLQPNSSAVDSSTVVQSTEKATVMVLVYR